VNDDFTAWYVVTVYRLNCGTVLDDMVFYFCSINSQ